MTPRRQRIARQIALLTLLFPDAGYDASPSSSSGEGDAKQRSSRKTSSMLAYADDGMIRSTLAARDIWV